MAKKLQKAWAVSGRRHGQPTADRVKIYTNETAAHMAASFAADTDKTRDWTVGRRYHTEPTR